MFIERDGKKIELTPAEIRAASDEQDMLNWCEDVSSKLEEAGCYGVCEKDVQLIAKRADDIRSKSDLFYEAYWLSVELAIREFTGGAVV